MKIVKEIFQKESGWKNIFQKGNVNNPQIVLAFENREIISENQVYQELKK